VFLVGKTGAGKSTILKLLTREVRQTSGSIKLQGRDIGRIKSREVPALRRQMGVVPQDFALLPRKRVWENLAYAMRAAGNTRKEVRTRVPDILEQVSMGGRADAFPHELSGGEQQRVAIARAVANAPRVLFADEPTGNLDPHTADHVFQALMQLVKATKVSMLIATHNMELAGRMDRRVSLSNGQVVELE
jgi:ABC-type ATPase involved in cell division